jgi:ribA/ribD-fused uncharacterized protein
VITEFRGPYWFLSSFSACPVLFQAHCMNRPVTWPSAEHAFQADKAKNEDTARIIWHAGNAREAKRFGRSLELRPGWEASKKITMMTVQFSKFTQNHDLGDRLVRTGDEPLVEGNDWGDDYWGACAPGRGRLAAAGQLPVWAAGLVGYNYLGRFLMTIRDILRED